MKAFGNRGFFVDLSLPAIEKSRINRFDPFFLNVLLLFLRNERDPL